MNYAVVHAEPFLASFLRLDAVVQEVILDDIEGIAQRPDLAIDSSDALEPAIEWHRHLGEVDGVRFDVVTWIAIDSNRRVITVAGLFDLNGDIEW